MNELLSVIIDFNAEVLAKMDMETFFNSIFKFLNLFRMQSAQAFSRLYIAFPHNSYLLFPLETGMSQESDDAKLVHQLAFKDQQQQIMTRLTNLLESPTFNEQLNQAQQSSQVSSALYKALCFAQGWLQQDLLSSSEVQSSVKTSRILIVQLGQDDPSQFGALVNGIFAAQKLKIAIDCFVMDFSPVNSSQEIKQSLANPKSFDQQITEPILLDKKGEQQDSHLLQQAAQLTDGLYLLVAYRSDIFGYLVHGGFLLGSQQRKQLRDSFKLPQATETAMSAFCVCCEKSQTIGHACSNCLSFHCDNETKQCRKCHRLFA